MKKMIMSVFVLILFTACSNYQKSSESHNEVVGCPLITEDKAPKLLWSTTDSMSGPESVVYDPQSKSFYVSNVAGGPVDKDGKGWISNLHKSGKMKETRWVSGLNAPKGMRIRNGYLWFSDIDEVKSILISKKKVSSTIKVPGAKFLNDVVISEKDSDVYVTDMFTNKIHSIRKSPNQKVFLENEMLENPNGIVISDGKLLIASWGPGIQSDFSTNKLGKILSVNEKTKEITSWFDGRIGNLDGIEIFDDETVLVSDWMAGKIFKVKKSGDCTTLLEGFKGSADFTYLPKEKQIIIPLMLENRVVSYQL